MSLKGKRQSKDNKLGSDLRAENTSNYSPFDAIKFH